MHAVYWVRVCSCAKGIYAYLGAADLSHVGQPEELDLTMVATFSNSPLRWLPALATWQQSNHAVGLPMAPAELAQAADADVRARLAKLPTSESPTPAPPSDSASPADASDAGATLSASEVQRYGMSLQDAQRLAIAQARANLNKQEADLQKEPTLREDTVVFRATVEKFTSKGWPLRCHEVAAAIGGGVQFK